MGIAQQLAKFTPELASQSAPLRDFLSMKNQWLWTDIHDQVFQNVKKLLTSPVTLKLYDVSRPTKLRVDGSRLNGIAVILYQKHGDKWHPVSRASRYLSDAEKNYHPIENEMLAVSWGCRKMNLYLHGLPHFYIQTDHKPLIPILNNKSLVEMSPRIQRLRMKLLQYNFTAEHVKGSDQEDADALSRMPHEFPSKEDELAEREVAEYVNTVLSNMPASNSYREEIKVKTKQDQILMKLKKMVEEGWPDIKKECPKDVQPYWASRHDISIIDNMLVKGTRIIQGRWCKKRKNKKQPSRKGTVADRVISQLKVEKHQDTLP